MGKVLNPTLLHRSLGKLKEETLNVAFFLALTILEMAATQRDPPVIPEGRTSVGIPEEIRIRLRKAELELRAGLQGHH